MPTDRVVDALNDQIASEFAAAHQYTAVAVHYASRSFPQLAGFFLRQAAEERTHALMMVRYLTDTSADVRFGAVPEARDEFDDHVAPIRLALDQERSVTRAISGIAAIAREDGDHVSEQFIQWFLREQVEEESTMSQLLDVAERVRNSPMTLEEFVAREHGELPPPDPTAPQALGD